MTHTTDTLNNATTEAAHQVHGVALGKSAGGRRLELVASVKQPQSARLAQTELGGDATEHGGTSVVTADAVERAMVPLQVSVEDLEALVPLRRLRKAANDSILPSCMC